MPIKLFKKFIREFDMFSTPATFRTNGQPETSNTCGGITSLLILIVFIYVFISQFIQVTNWQQIQSVLTQNNTFDSTRQVSNFMVGVGMQNLRIEGITQYMRFEILQITKNGSTLLKTRTLQTQKCTLQHISDLGQQAQSSFNSFNLKNKLCLALNQNYTIQQPSDGVYSTLVVQVNACRRKNPDGTAMYANCADQNFTLYRSQLWANTYKYFVADVVYINTAFNPLSKTPTSKFMQSVRLTFTANLGSQAFVYLSTYQLNTDVSIFPVEQIQKQYGNFLQSIITNNCQVIWYFEHASCTFLLSSTSIMMTRTLGKLDSILSYAGGLFGIIISFLSFFMMSFNKLRYQIMASQSAFKCNQDGQKIRQQDFHFFMYIKYTLYDWIKILTCYQMKWKDCQEIDQTLQQAVQQLDISLMFKKIQYFQRFIQHIMTDKQKIGMFLTQPPSIQQVRKKRMIAQYYDKIIKGKPVVTIQDLNIATGIFQLAINKLIQTNSIDNLKNREQIQYFLQRDDYVQYSIQKYQEMLTKQQLEQQQQYQFNQQQMQVQKQISFEVFTIVDPIRKKQIIKKIPMKILRRLYRIKNNLQNVNQGLINLQI